ncbi:arsenate reductase family protein [Thalassospira sp. MA62]|nr:arsenate reductase family protein [Thalassospira sp. MA62]
MTQVIFYEKPGCRTNNRQKRALLNAGHTIDSRNLLTAAWTRNDLMAFFGQTPVASWFNVASPRITSGEIDPTSLDGETAMELILADHLLIRRPLVEAWGQKCAGFDREPVLSLIGERTEGDGLEGCSHPQGPTGACPPPHARKKQTT